MRSCSFLDSAGSFLVILLLVAHPNQIFGVICYKCQTMSAVILKAPPPLTGPPLTKPPLTQSPLTESPYKSWEDGESSCNNFASASDDAKEGPLFTGECDTGCNLAVDIPEAVNGSGFVMQLEFEYRGCFFNFTDKVVMDTCLNSPILPLFEHGEEFMSEFKITEKNEDSRKLCSCNVDYCNLDLNKISYFPSHNKFMNETKQEQKRNAENSKNNKLKGSGAIRSQNLRTSWFWANVVVIIRKWG